MGAPLLKYDPGTGEVTINFVRGPASFEVRQEARVHDNVATSGLRERVFEAADLLISFTMPAMAAGDDLEDWAAFMAWALRGGVFQFSPNADLADWYNCVVDGTEFRPARVGMRRYSASFTFRVVPDVPADAASVLLRFWGIE